MPTELNRQGVLQGRCNVAIAQPVDEQQIEGNLQKIAQYQPIKILASPLNRALQTASAYGFGDQVIVDERLIEFDFGIFEKKPRDQLSEFQGGIWLKSFTQVSFGEGFEALRNRLDSFLKDHANLDCVLIFSHGVVIRYLVAKATGRNLDRANQIVIGNNELSVVEYGT